jgi:hypothetical protein
VLVNTLDLLQFEVVGLILVFLICFSIFDICGLIQWRSHMLTRGSHGSPTKKLMFFFL